MTFLPIIFTPNYGNGATPFFANDRFTPNGLEWCQENQALYEILGEKFFEHHDHSIESRICANLIEDPLWTYEGPDRIEKLIERSHYFVQLEISESVLEAQEGVIDPNPVEISPETPIEVEKKLPIENATLKKQENLTAEIIEHESDPNKNNNSEMQGGGCLIATAAFGSELSPQIQHLRELRDNTILQTKSGKLFLKSFNEFYYLFSPTIADWERENKAFKDLVKISITPLVMSIFLFDLAEADTEGEILIYGIGIISLNIGMYLVFPGIAILQIRKKLHSFNLLSWKASEPYQQYLK